MKHPEDTQGDSRVRRAWDAHLAILQARTDKVFQWLLIGQWLFGIGCALYISPRALSGVHDIDEWVATAFGAAVISLPLFLIRTRPGSALTRYVVATAQMVYSSLLIHLMGGRIEAHFHVFGSLAILAFYRDAKVFVPAVLVIVADHLLRAMFWPESVFGIAAVAPWRAVEHAAWILFETSFLIWGVAQSRSDLLVMSQLQISLTDERDQLESKMEKRVSELRQQRLLLQEVIDNIPGAVSWKDSQLRYVGCNNAFAAAAGLPSPDEIVGKTDLDLPWTPAETACYRQRDWEVMETRDAKINIEEIRQGEDGSQRTLLRSKVPLLNAAGQAVGVLGIFQDVSERKKLESQLSQAQKLESMGQLAAGIAHEINTPMQCVSGNVEFLKNCYEKVFDVVDKYREYLEGAERSWQERKAEMNKLLTKSRYDHWRREAPAAIEEASEAVQRVVEIVRAMKAMSHPGTAEKVSTDVNEIIRNAAAISKNRWKYVAELDLVLEDGLPCIQALPAELSQVLLNLIVNAADAIAEKNGDGGNQLGLITVRTRTEEEGVRIDVQDTGCGITEEIKHRVFDPFFTTKDVGKGTGQGLAIAYDLIANKHQGRLTLDPGPGRGATFTVWLPIGSDHVQNVDAHDEQFDSTDSTSASPVSEELAPALN